MKTGKHRIKKRICRNRMCLICGEEYKAEPNEEGAICPTCRAEYSIETRKKNEYPCDRRRICKKCAHRVRMSSAGEGHYICACVIHTGEIRDLKGNDKHCETFEPKGLKKYEDA